MSRLFSLGKRLQKCADMVRTGVAVADIGTDHGYLPIWLLKSGKAVSAVAADIGEGPLTSAKQNAEKYHTTIKTVLSDGFKNISPEEFDDAVIAGMGGELISRLISSAEYLRDKNKHLVLQPMTAIPELRAFLFENGFVIDREDAVTEDNKIYSVMSVNFVDEKIDFLPEEIYIGKILPNSENSREYAEKVISRIKNQLKGLVHKGETSEAKKLENIIKNINEKYLSANQQ